MIAKVKDRPKAATDYEADFHAWLTEQAALLRSGATGNLDSVNIAEELDGLARSEFRTLVSTLRILLLHMLKWDERPDRRAASWTASIREQRSVYSDVIEDNPSLKSRIEDARTRAYRRARDQASDETGLPIERFPAECPYDWDDMLKRPYRTDSRPEQR